MVDAGARRRTPNHCALALAAASLIAALLARGQPPAAAGKPQVFTSRSNLVLLPTRVQDKRGEAIYGLRAEQFIVEDNGARQSVQVDEEPDEERDAAGLSLVVAVQCGRSAPAEFAKLKGLAAMVDAIVGEAPHEVALIGYGQTPYLLGDFSSKPDAFRFALSRLKPCGDYHAAAIDAVEYAIGMLKRSLEHNRRAILLIGETRDHGSSTKLNDVVSELGINDTVIYSVAFCVLITFFAFFLRSPFVSRTFFFRPSCPFFSFESPLLTMRTLSRRPSFSSSNFSLST